MTVFKFYSVMESASHILVIENHYANKILVLPKIIFRTYANILMSFNDYCMKCTAVQKKNYIKNDGNKYCSHH